MIGNHITNICEMDLHLYLTYSSEGHNPIQAGTISYHTDERTLFFSPRMEPHPPHRWKTFNQAGTTTNTMMKELCSFHQGWNHIRHTEERFLHLHLTYSSEGHALTSDLAGTESCTLVRMAPSPRLSYLVTDQAPPLSRRVAVALTSVLLNIMASTHICHGRNLIL